MTDVHHPSVRSKNMSAIKSKNTKPELLIRKALYKRGLRFRLHVKDLPGCPDIVLPRYKAVIFVHGCFWHGHRCHLCKTPKTRSEFWLTKMSSNISRDQLVNNKLLGSNWRVGVVWECAVKGRTRLPLDQCVDELVTWIRDSKLLGIEISGGKYPNSQQ